MKHVSLDVLKIKAISGYMAATPNGGSAILVHDVDHEKMLAYRSPTSNNYNWIHQNYRKTA